MSLLFRFLLISLFSLTLLPAVASPQGSPFKEMQKLLASDSVAGDDFGSLVAISGDTIVVGARSDDDAGSDSGAAYVFQRNQGGLDSWSQVAKLTASDAAADDDFGNNVAISGDTILVASTGNDAGVGVGAGAVYIFERNQGGLSNWGEVKKLTASDKAANDQFGELVAVSDDANTILIGAQFNDAACPSDPNCNSGGAYIFERSQGGENNWGEVKKVIPSDAAFGDHFGVEGAIGGDTIVVGAIRDDDACPSDPNCNSGSAYIFERNHGGLNNWGETTKITASDGDANSQFAFDLAISGNTIVVEARLDDDVGTDSGSAYVFERNHGGLDNWGEVKKLTASDAASGDFFGSAVSISGGMIIVGALFDDDAGSDSGSVYVFGRNQGGLDNWGEIGKITASDAAPLDRFGAEAAIDGNTILIGAPRDDDAGNDSGSAYVFSILSLTMPSKIPIPDNLSVSVPVTFFAGGQEIAATAFSVDFDETCLAFDPTDGNSDGIPDAVTFSVPPDFTPSVTFTASDTMGELDIAIVDLSVPLTIFPDGVIATITFTPICIPTDTSIIAPINFGPFPVASFGDTTGQSAPGTTVNGSVEILPGTPGDCNGDGIVDAGDLIACVLEFFDSDGNVWTNVASGTFLGSSVGCDANQDFVVDAGDFSCKILLIFNGVGACTSPPLRVSSSVPEILLGQSISQGTGKTVAIPLTFEGNGHGVTAGAFSVDYDEACLSFDPSDGISFALPAGVSPSVSFDASDSAGELDISFLDLALPFAVIPDGPMATLKFTTQCDPGDGEIDTHVRFSSAPTLSFGDTSGQSVPGIGLNGGIKITSAFFSDGFESGDATAWSSTP